MSIEDYYVQQWLYSWKGLVLLIGLLILFIIFRKEISHRYFVYFMNAFEAGYNKMADPIKAKLFSSLHEITSFHSELRHKGIIKILEIGVGTGANLIHLPKGAEYTVQDLNPHMIKVYEKNKSKNPSLNYQKYLVGSAEEMTDIPDGSYDVVIATLLLCSVTNIHNVVKESYRVLSPGGKFYFMEHVISKSQFIRYIQVFLDYTYIWPTIADGCCLIRDPLSDIQETFDDVDYKYFNLAKVSNIGVNMKMCHPVISPHLMGVATKLKRHPS